MKKKIALFYDCFSRLRNLSIHPRYSTIRRKKCAALLLFSMEIHIFVVMKEVKNVVFDLGGVVFARDPKKFEPEFIKFFSYITLPKMPKFWEDYDRGVVSYDEVLRSLAEYNSCDVELAEKNLLRSIRTQEVIPPTRELIRGLKSANYKLYVLSNMSLEFIKFLREVDVYKYFDGEVVSCEEHVVKPEAEIYHRLESRYGLVPSETLFIDDRKANIVMARELGWQGYVFDAHNPSQSCAELTKLLLEDNL